MGNRLQGKIVVYGSAVALKGLKTVATYSVAREDVPLALFLTTEESNFIVGQAIPFTGGWIQR